jgi:hypothetical protein
MSDIQEQQLQALKDISTKMDDLYREMREVKVRLSEISK